MDERQMIKFEWDGVERSINALVENLENPKPVLRQFASRVLVPATKQNIASGGVGWAPYAKSTLERMQATGTSQVTARGTIRANRRKRFASAIKKHARKLQESGWSQDWQNTQDRLEKRLANYDKSLLRAQRLGEKAAKAKKTLDHLIANPGTKGADKKRAAAEKTLAREKNKLGKRENERRRLLQAMPGTIRATVKPGEDGARLIVYSAAGPVGGAHNYGEGREPRREFLPPPDMGSHMATLAQLLEKRFDKAWRHGK